MIFPNVAWLLLNAFIFYSMTHAKPVPYRRELSQSRNVDTIPTHAQRDTETTMSSRSNSIPAIYFPDDQLFPRANDGTHFEQMITDAERMKPDKRKKFFSSDMETQWEDLHKASGEPNANECDLIQFAAKQLEYLRKLTTAKNLRLLIPNDMDLVAIARPYIDSYIDYVARRPYFPPSCMSTATARVVIEGVGTNPDLLPNSLRLREYIVGEHELLDPSNSHKSQLVIEITWDLAFIRNLEKDKKMTGFENNWEGILSKITITSDKKTTDIKLSAENTLMLVENAIMRWTRFQGIVHMSRRDCLVAGWDDLKFFKSLTQGDESMVRLRDVGDAYRELYKKKCMAAKNV